MESDNCPAMSDVEVICPTADELMESPKRNVPCTVEGCDKLLATTAARKMHVIKRHGIYQDTSDKNIFSNHPQAKNVAVKKHFFCPVEDCSRNRNGNNPFSKLWPLKQHYQQVHGERNFLCTKCDFPFAFDAQRRKHEEKCGMVYTCSCSVPFTTRQALFMHAKRKQHKLPGTEQSKGAASSQQSANEGEASENTQHNEGSPSSSTEETIPTLRKIITIPIPVSQAGGLPHLITLPDPSQMVESSATGIKAPIKKRSKTERFLLPKPSILHRAAALHPSTTQIVTINKGLVTSIPLSALPSPPAKKLKKTLSTQTSGVKRRPAKLRKGVCVPQEGITSVSQPGENRSSARVFRDLGINTQLNSLTNGETQTVVKQNSAHTQTPGDVIMLEALLSANINTQNHPSKQQQQQFLQRQQLPQQQHHQQLQFPELQQQHQVSPPQQLQQGIPAFTRHTQTKQLLHTGVACSLANTRSIASLEPLDVPQYTMQTQTQFSTNTTTNCDVQTESWLSSLVTRNQGTFTHKAGVPTQTDVSLIDFLNLSNSETQTVLSHSALEASTQTARNPASTNQIETSIQTIMPQPQVSDNGSTPQSTMETQTNFYSACLDALLLNESQSQTSPGRTFDEDLVSCCQQTQTLAPIPQTDHQQTQTPLPNLNISNSDFLLLDMYTQTAQRGLQNSSLQTQTDPFLEYSLSSMQTQTMADFDLGAFDYHSISVQTDSQLVSESVNQLTNTTQVQTQTSNMQKIAGGGTVARDVQTETEHMERLYDMCSAAFTDNHTQTG